MLLSLYFIEKRPFFKKTPCTHAYILPKKRPLSQKYNYLMSFLSKFLPFAATPLFGQKNVNSVKTTLYYRPKKSGCLFFLIFQEIINSLVPIFCQENVLSPKNLTTVMPIFCKKMSILSKTQFSNVIFFKSVMKKPLLPCPYLVK